MCVCVKRSVTLRPRGLQPARLLCPPNSSDRKAGVGSHSLLKGDLPNPGIEPGSPAWWADSLPAEPPGIPIFVTHTQSH